VVDDDAVAPPLAAPAFELLAVDAPPEPFGLLLADVAPPVGFDDALADVAPPWLDALAVLADDVPPLDDAVALPAFPPTETASAELPPVAFELRAVEAPPLSGAGSVSPLAPPSDDVALVWAEEAFAPPLPLLVAPPVAPVSLPPCCGESAGEVALTELHAHNVKTARRLSIVRILADTPNSLPPTGQR